MTKSFASIVITGASSGIGEALALDYAAPASPSRCAAAMPGA